MKSGITLWSACTAVLMSSCTYYVPVTHAPSIDAFHASGTTNVMVTQRLSTGVVGWQVRQAFMDSTGLHGRFYPLTSDVAEKAHFLRRPGDANRLGKFVVFRLHPGDQLALKTANEGSVPKEMMAEVVFSEKDRYKSSGRTVALGGVGLVVAAVVALMVYAITLGPFFR